MGRPPGAGQARAVSAEDLDKVMNPTPRVRGLTDRILRRVDRLDWLVGLYRPYVDGLATLPRDGRFLLVGNHTQAGYPEVLLTPYFTYRELGVRVRPLAERGFAQLTGFAGDLLAACGAVIGHPDTAAELMRHDQTILVFPGGGREISKFKGEEYQLRWQGRSGFARVAIAHDYPIVPVGLVGGDDVYRSLNTRDGALGRFSQAVAQQLSGKSEMAMPLVQGIGPTLLPRPQRMYLRFGEPIETARPPRRSAATWEATVKERTQAALETVLGDLQVVRSTDPYRSLNPLMWRRAVL